ncbi:MAG: hypothetical protein H6810_12850 [Phycisphaeraceae bacterium]|nr:MAG: hypothetical protein H6810_12850 [Phycisphaeraceae bacterium]
MTSTRVLLTGFAITLATSAGLAAPTFGWRLTATNNTGANANDFHTVIAGTGGSVANIVLTDVPGGDGVAGPNDPVAANGIDVVWPTTNVMNGQTIKLDFTVDHAGDLDIVSIYWTHDGTNIGAPPPGTYTFERSPVPTPGTLGLACAGGLLTARRRRR